MNDVLDGERRIQTVCLLLLTVVAVGFALAWLRPVMIPFVLSLFFALALSPLVDVLARRARLPRPVAVAATLLLGGLMLAALGALVSASVGQLAANRAAYQDQAAALAAEATAALPIEAMGLEREAVLERLREIPVASVGRLLMGTTNAVVDLLSQSFLVLIFVVFLLIGGEARAPRRDTWAEIASSIERYIVAKAVISAATGMLTWAILALLGIDLALVFGLFAFLLNFIPSVGSAIATLLPLPVVLMSPEVSTSTAVLAIALPGAVQFTLGNVVEPRVMGRSLDLHPVAILLSLILWGMLWGVVGMLLAAPMTAVARLLFEKLPLTRPVAELLAGRLDGLRGGAEPPAAA